MKQMDQCEIVQDLLPLYADGVCHEASRRLVETHLKECRNCAGMLAQLRDDTTESKLKEEMDRAFLSGTGKLRRKSAVVGAVVAGILAIPVLVCLIVNLATGQGLSWFFIVLASILLTASLTAVPLWVPKHRFLWSLGTGTGSLMLLLGVCALYTGGKWFFVAASACLFGIAVLLLPFVVRCEPLRGVLKKQKALTVMTVASLLFILMMFCIGRSYGAEGFGRMALSCSAVPFVWIWGLFAALRYGRNGWRKTGLSAAWTGIAAFFADSVTGWLIGSPIPLPRFSTGAWSRETAPDRILWLILIGGCLIGAILYGIGLVRKKKGEKTK